MKFGKVAAMSDQSQSPEGLMECSGCGCSKALCLGHKLHGAIACCPDCKHVAEPQSPEARLREHLRRKDMSSATLRGVPCR